MGTLIFFGIAGTLLLFVGMCASAVWMPETKRSKAKTVDRLAEIEADGREFRIQRAQM